MNHTIMSIRTRKAGVHFALYIETLLLKLMVEAFGESTSVNKKLLDQFKKESGWSLLSTRLVYAELYAASPNGEVNIEDYKRRLKEHTLSASDEESLLAKLFHSGDPKAEELFNEHAENQFGCMKYYKLWFPVFIEAAATVQKTTSESLGQNVSAYYWEVVIEACGLRTTLKGEFIEKMATVVANMVDPTFNHFKDLGQVQDHELVQVIEAVKTKIARNTAAELPKA